MPIIERVGRVEGKPWAVLDEPHTSPFYYALFYTKEDAQEAYEYYSILKAERDKLLNNGGL